MVAAGQWNAPGHSTGKLSPDAHPDPGWSMKHNSQSGVTLIEILIAVSLLSLLSVGMLLNGEMIPDRSERGEPVRGDTLLLLLHAHHEPLDWKLPDELWGPEWEVVVDTARPCEAAGERRCRAGETLALDPRSLVVLRRTG